MDLDEIYRRVSDGADAMLPDILMRVLLADLPLPADFPGCCAKCGPLLTRYVHAKIMLHRFDRRSDWGDYLGRSRTGECGTILRARVLSARSAFHAEPCLCGLELWRGRNWREKQSQEYQQRWFSYVTSKKELS